MLGLSMLAIGVAFLAASPAGINAAQVAGQTVDIDNDDLGGVVTSANGPEAGVWVIAETTDLPTKFVKIVVTDDQGRYLPFYGERCPMCWANPWPDARYPRILGS